MKTLAVCFYGITSHTVALEKLILEKFKEFDISIFSDYTTDPADALLNVAYKKRCDEITKRHDYNICMAIDTALSLDVIHSTTIKNIENNFLYFTKGFFKHPTQSTGVSKEIFYATSITFDRACEFKIDLGYIDTAWLRGQDQEELFYYHLKSLNIQTECIDCENSNMFIRST